MKSARIFLVCLVLFTMVASGFSGAFAYSLAPKSTTSDRQAASRTDPSIQVMTVPLTFGDVIASDLYGYTVLTVEGAPNKLMKADGPMVPMFSKMLSFPVNTKIVSVSIEQAVHSKTWTDTPVIPAPEAVPLIDGQMVPGLKEGPAYTQSALYPEKDVDQMVTTGQSDWGAIEAHLFVKVFPLRYNPVTGEIVKLDSCELVIRYVPPAKVRAPMANQTHYDVLVLHPDLYGNATRPYITHRESTGWKVKNVSLSEIYSNKIFNVSKGRDNPEKIKLFIKQAIENWTIAYVLVVGDDDKFPIRRAYIADIDGTATPTDLYYEDIFKGGTTTFSDWNKNNNAYWGESSAGNKNTDETDLDPDIAVGRWPVGSVLELDGVVAKTISYDENITKPDAYDWFRNVTLVGSNTFTQAIHGDTSGIAEGEYAMDYDSQFMGGFKISKFYEMSHTLVESNVLKSVNNGVGMMAFADHGSPSGVVYGQTPGYGGFGFSSTDAKTATNGHKLPLSVMDACQTHEIDDEEALGEYLILNPNGGAIGTIGSTRIAYGSFGTWHIEANSGFLDTHIFKEHQNGTIMPSLMLDKAKRDYLNEVGLWDYADFKTQVQYIYFGDPVVFLGGPPFQVEPVSNPLSLAPGETSEFLIGLNNTGLISDDLIINITGGNFSYTLSDYSMHMKADSMTYITVGVTVPSNALANIKDNVTLSVTPKSTTIPILTNLTTIVKSVRNVVFGLDKSDIRVVPGHHFEVNFSVDNKGNVIESASAALTGGDGDFQIEVTKSNLQVTPYHKLSNSLSVSVPDTTLADTYYLELALTTQSGASKVFVITLHVEEIDGMETYIIDNTQEFNDLMTANFQVYIGNTGNHRERFQLTMTADSAWNDYVSWDLPGTISLDPLDSITEPFTVRASQRAPAGSMGLHLTVASAEPTGFSQTLDLTATVKKVSSLGLMAMDKVQNAKQGESATFELIVTSGSNFEETVTLTVEGAPSTWTMSKDVENLVLPAYSSGHVNLTFKVPAKYLAGDSVFKAIAKGNSSMASEELQVTVEKSNGLGLGLDKTDFSGYGGDTNIVTVTIENKGNHEDMFIVGVDSITEPFEYMQSSTMVTIGAWAKAETSLTIVIPAEVPVKDGVLKVRARSASDSQTTAVMEVKLHSLFKAKPDMTAHGDGASSTYPGQTQTFTVTLINKGNVDEAISIKNNSTTTWNLQFPANVSLKPGEVKDITVSYDVPKGTTAGQYPMALALSSSDGNWNIAHTSTVQKVPTKKASGSNGMAAALPYLLIIIVLIVVVLVLAIMLALKGRSKKVEPEMMVGPAPPMTAATAPAPGPELGRVPEPVKVPEKPAPVATPVPANPPTPAPEIKSIGGGGPAFPKEAPKAQVAPPSVPAPAKPVSDDEAIDNMLKGLDEEPKPPAN
jgi:uncharacterized membrane protein